MATRFSVPLVRQQSRGIFLYILCLNCYTASRPQRHRCVCVFQRIVWPCVAGCRFRPMTFKGRGQTHLSYFFLILLIAT
ncbi:hypothetical protein GHT06_013634 [Daphnia sinensis]|uniref:Uncharacterized protein n=1 Tax=Daphnia sinensis TaxID=1820382 RepID=A0AAD5KU72_9CRUS|nr:hypothetical protein GHT06_013634 [Daphnia sinensis]